MRILLGTTNPSKVKRFSDLLKGYDVEFVTLKDLAITDEPEENGITPEENAIAKAKFYGQYFEVVICNDSGLYFEELALDDVRQPGLNVRTPMQMDRLSDEEMIDKASSKRFEGWPLDSLSMNKETGKYFVDGSMEESKENIIKDEYEKENLHQFEKEGHFFWKKYGNFPRLEKNIINNNSEGKRKLKKCYYIRCKYKLARYDGAENIRDVLEEYEILLELLEREQSEDPKNINVWLCQLRKCFVSEDLFRRMLESEFPFLDNSQQIQQVPVTTNIKKDLADECMEYVVKNKMPAGFQEINSQDEWKEFQLKIRRKLLKHELRKGEYERFVTVLFWAFQYSADGKAIRQGNLLWSSYDLREICIFIQRLKFPLNLKLGKAVKTRLFE